MVLLGAMASAVLAADAPPKSEPAAKTEPTAKAAPPAKAEPTAKKKPAAEKENSCLECHSQDNFEGDMAKFHVTEKHLAKDIHWQKGLRCVDCHGGDPTSYDIRPAHSAEAKFRTVKSPADVPNFCGECHANIEFMRHYQPSPRTDQLREYWTSGHGRRLKEANDPKVATCLSCHGGKHGIIAVGSLESPVYRTKIAQTCAKCHSDEKLMAGRKYHDQPLGHSQYEEWRQSVHGKAMMDKGDLSAATCNNCHGNHGALPPDIGSVANACGACHNKVADLFAKTAMRHHFEKVGLPGCAACHNNHKIGHPTDKMLGMTGDAVCVKCHVGGKFGATLTGANTARSMREGLDRLEQMIGEAESKLGEAERKGMEVSVPRFDLRKARSAQTNARTVVHTFAAKAMQEALDEGFKTTDEIIERADGALREYTARRVWLAASLVPILIVVILLLLYIRALGIPAARSPVDDRPSSP